MSKQNRKSVNDGLGFIPRRSRKAREITTSPSEAMSSFNALRGL